MLPLSIVLWSQDFAVRESGRAGRDKWGRKDSTRNHIYYPGRAKAVVEATAALSAVGALGARSHSLCFQAPLPQCLTEKRLTERHSLLRSSCLCSELLDSAYTAVPHMAVYVWPASMVKVLLMGALMEANWRALLFSYSKAPLFMAMSPVSSWALPMCIHQDAHLIFFLNSNDLWM
jgi:hypothetical protein